GVLRRIVLAQGQALHPAAERSVPRLRAEGADTRAAPRASGRDVAARGERERARPRLHDEDPNRGPDGRRRGDDGRGAGLRVPGDTDDLRQSVLLTSPAREYFHLINSMGTPQSALL